MATNPKVNKAIQSVLKIIQSLVEKNYKNLEKEYYLDSMDDSIFTTGNSQIQDVLKKIELEYSITATDEFLESQKNEVEQYNESINTNVQDFILLSAFHSSIQSRIENYIQSETTSKHDFFNSLALILDFELSYAANVNLKCNTIFYDSLRQVTRLLMSISTATIEGFWGYFESRLGVIMNKIFGNTTVERISLLYTFNYLTDKFQSKDESGKRDSYKRDSFNDTFHARVRFLVVNILDFEDNTGLNKYFLVSNRTSPSLQSNDPYLANILEIQKLLRDPLHYLKPENHKQLKTLSDKCKKVAEEIINKEYRFRMDYPLHDQFHIVPPKSDDEQEYLMEKYSKLTYVPETYFTSLFKNKERKLQFEDKLLFESSMKQSTTRMQYLFLICVVAHLVIELLQKYKRQFLDSLGASSNVNHFIDFSAPDEVVKTFIITKRETLSAIKDFNMQYSYFIQHLLLSEKYLWGWVIYGKDPKTKKPLLADKQTTVEQLEKVSEDFKNVYRYKDSRYFNTYVTPQVTRKMRTKRGLSELNSVDAFAIEDTKRNVEDIDYELSSTDDINTKHELLEKKSLLSWRLLRNERSNNWFDAAQKFREEMLSHQEEIKLDEDDIEDGDDEDMPDVAEGNAATENEGKRQLEEDKDEANDTKRTKLVKENTNSDLQESHVTPQLQQEPEAEKPKDELDEIKPELEEPAKSDQGIETGGNEEK